MDGKRCKALLIGIGGFGKIHANMMKELAGDSKLDIVAFAEIRPEAYPETYAGLTAAGAAHYADYERMLAEHPEADFAAIATPIAAHKTMVIRALRMGFHVLVEKPPAVTVQDLDEMIAVRRESGKRCQVNFQNTSGRAFRHLLERIGEGALGTVKHVTGVGMWNRTRSYYERTRWAGKLMCDGEYVLDGTINNPLAHLLHNSLIVAGGGDASRAAPVRVQAELYHANDIEGDDTSCVRIETASGADVHFYGTMCHDNYESPYIAVSGTEGEALWDYQNNLTIRNRDGETVLSFGQEELVRNMYVNLIEAIRDDGLPLYAPLEHTRSFVAASNGAFESSGAIRAIPSPHYRQMGEGGGASRHLPDLSERMKDAAGKRLLFSEYGFPWAVPTKPFPMDGYVRFELPAGMRT
ncbi:Gfo/Idh/MocA family protein [Paenibacillus flagellatus]|uniref:Gfo/Idh/MocA family protein n=1 Tax=Paenibacillus flagellatus TaxID=2211139 RepID=UPI001FE61FF6|nr:Gfo/Idh/MocA family oxidoreductase [Paenibacillus flagellatus]